MWFWNEMISGSKVFKHENFWMFVIDGKRDPVHMFTLRWIIQHRLSISLNSQGKLVYIIVCSVAMISLAVRMCHIYQRKKIMMEYGKIEQHSILLFLITYNIRILNSAINIWYLEKAFFIYSFDREKITSSYYIYTWLFYEFLRHTLCGKPLCENQNSFFATCRYEYLWTVQLYLDLIKGIIISTRKEMQMYTFFWLCYAL